MESLRARVLTAALLAAVGLPALAAPLFGADDLQRNGAVSRHLWTPDVANGELGRFHVSAGVAVGLRDNLRCNLGRSTVPALTLHLERGASVSLLPAGSRGVMLVLQTRP